MIIQGYPTVREANVSGTLQTTN